MDKVTLDTLTAMRMAMCDRCPWWAPAEDAKRTLVELLCVEAAKQGKEFRCHVRGGGICYGAAIVHLLHIKRGENDTRANT